MCTQWCCECDVDSFNGVLSHTLRGRDGREYVLWDVHDPGPRRRFIFEKVNCDLAFIYNLHPNPNPNPNPNSKGD